MEKTVSVIITTHNRQKLLQRAVESVFSQTYSNLEIIIVDDHSTDQTHEYCRSLDNIIYVYISQGESKGGNYARNCGIKKATGDYIAFLDDDDYWLSTKIEKQVALIESKNCELVYCGCFNEVINNDKTKMIRVLPLPSNQGDMSSRILTTIPTTTSNILVSRECINAVGGFDESLRFWQEYELLIRLAQRKPFYFVNEPLSIYRIDRSDQGRLSNKYKAWIQAVKYIHTKHNNLYKKLSFVEKLFAKNLEWNDASKRCKASGDWVNEIKYFVYSFPIRSIRLIMRKIYWMRLANG